MLEHQDRVRYVLTDGRHHQQVFVSTRENAVVLGSVSREGAQSDGPSLPKAEGLQEVLKFIDRCIGEGLPTGKTFEEAVVEACNRLCPRPLEQDLDADELVQRRSRFAPR